MGVNNMEFPIWTNYLKKIRNPQIPINDNQTVEKNSRPECLVGLPRSGKLLSIRHVGPDPAIKISTVLFHFTSIHVMYLYLMPFPEQAIARKYVNG